MDTDTFIVYIKTNDIYKDISEDVETRIGTSNYEIECNPTDKSLSEGKNKKSNWIKKSNTMNQVKKS